MGPGVALQIGTDGGGRRDVNALCTFTYKNKNYLITSDGSYFLYLYELKCGLWKGLYIKCVRAGEDAAAAGDALIKKAESNPDFYALGAEHYDIKGENGDFNIRKHAKLCLLGRRAKIVPFAAHLTVAVLLSLLYAFLCVHTSEIVFAANVFVGASREELVAAVYLIHVLGALFLFFARPFSR
ncbi:MAG: hypothetical protein IKX78_03690, partial [Clostridia bacterium]|nr:hypothetical protein [Clostridia bacterium]